MSDKFIPEPGTMLEIVIEGADDRAVVWPMAGPNKSACYIYREELLPDGTYDQAWTKRGTHVAYVEKTLQRWGFRLDRPHRITAYEAAAVDSREFRDEFGIPAESAVA